MLILFKNVKEEKAMKQILNYFKTFNKVILSEKIPFLYTLLLPAGLFIFNNYKNLGQNIPVSHLLLQTVNYVGYVIVIAALNGIGMQLVNFRDSGFLKTYTMISGGEKKYPVLGLFLSEMLFGYLCTIIFALVVAAFSIQNIVLILVFYSITYLVAATPVMLASVIIGSFNVKMNTLGTGINIALLVLMWISATRPTTDNLFMEIIYGLDPVDYVTQVLIAGNRLLFAQNQFAFQALSVGVLIAVFTVIGFVAIPRVKLNSTMIRN